MKNLSNYLSSTFQLIFALFFVLAFSMPTEGISQEGFIRIKNTTGRPANDLHIQFKKNRPLLVTMTINGKKQNYGNVFRNGKPRRGNPNVWDFDGATQNVPNGHSVSIIINYGRDRNGDPVTPEIDYRNSYWTFNGRRIPVRGRGNTLRANIVEILGIAQDQQGRPLLPKSPAGPNDGVGQGGNQGGNQGGANQGGGGNDGPGQGGGDNADQGECKCMGVSFSVTVKVRQPNNGNRVVREKSFNVNVSPNEYRPGRNGSNWGKSINISKADLPVAQNEMIELQINNINVNCQCDPPEGGECTAYPYKRSNRPGIGLEVLTGPRVNAQPERKTVQAGGDFKTEFNSTVSRTPIANVKIKAVCKGCGGEAGASQVQGTLRITFNKNATTGIPAGGQGGNQGGGLGTGGNQGNAPGSGGNQGGNNDPSNPSSGNNGGSSGGNSGNQGGSNSGGNSGQGTGGNQGGSNSGGTSGGGTGSQSSGSGDPTSLSPELIQIYLQNFQKTRNFHGMCGTGLAQMSRMYPQEYQQFLQKEQEIAQALHQAGVQLPAGCGFNPSNYPPPSYRPLLEEMGAEVFKQYLQSNKQQWGNYQGLCGTSIMELQRNFPKLYQEFLDREKALENYMANN